jgi:hypothetical protein
MEKSHQISCLLLIGDHFGQVCMIPHGIEISLVERRSHVRSFVIHVKREKIRCVYYTAMPDINVG